MNLLNMKSATVAAAIGAACIGMTSQVWAGIEDYEFQLIQNEVKEGDGAIVAVRLIDKRSGKPVPDAVIIAKRVDMAPDGMADIFPAIASSTSGSSPRSWASRVRVSSPCRYREESDCC